MKPRARLLAGCGTIAAAIALAPSTLLACPVCFQADAGPTTAGLRAAVITLVAITGCVLTGFVIYLRGTEVFSTDLAVLVPEVGAASPDLLGDAPTSGTKTAKSVENTSVPL